MFAKYLALTTKDFTETSIGGMEAITSQSLFDDWKGAGITTSSAV